MAADWPLTLYRFLSYAAWPLAEGLIAWRARRGKEDPNRRAERFGYAPCERPIGPLTWVHAASVGELNACLDVVRALTKSGHFVLVTTGTTSSAEIAASTLPEGASHAYIPLDIAHVVDRFLSHWQPDRALFVESEIWPGMLGALKRRQIPVYLINGRISEKSTARWRRHPAISTSVFRCFKKVLASSPGDAERFVSLGAPCVHLTGNLKFDRAPLKVDAAARRPLQSALAGRQSLIAISTHSGEEALLLEAFAALRQKFPRLALVIVPRHPERATDIAALVGSKGLSAQLRREGEVLPPDTDVLVFQTLGEVGLALHLSDFVYMGGSLVNRGGQNPIEAASLGRFVVHGPQTHNFRDVYRALDDGGAAQLVSSVSELIAALDWLLHQPNWAQERGQIAHNIVSGSRGALARTLEALDGLVSLDGLDSFDALDALDRAGES